MFNVSHLTLTLFFRVPADLLDALAFLPGFMNWNLLLYIEMFLQVINTTACNLIRNSDPICSNWGTDAPLTGLFQAPEGSSCGYRDIAYCTDCRIVRLSASFLLGMHLLHVFYLTLMKHWIYSKHDSCFNLIFQTRWLHVMIFLSCKGRNKTL